MSNKVVFKAQALARDLEVRLQNRIKGVSTQMDLDANRFPTIKCTVSAKSCFLRIKTDFERSEESGKVDALGLNQRVYAPHMTEFLREDTATQDAASLEMLAQVLAEIAKNGTKIVIMEGPAVENAATFAAAAALATDVVAEIRSDDIHPLTAQV